jgi:hypothetical protein
MKPPLLFLVLCILIFSCSKSGRVNPCTAVRPFEAVSTIGERVGDSAIETDTAFIGTIIFEGSKDYLTQEWKIGDDPRTFTQEKFTLNFYDPLPQINVFFSASGIPNKECFQNDSGSDSSIKHLTILPRDSNAKTELIGDYLGYVEGKPTDTFTVSIKFYSDSKYYPLFGLQPFY